MTMSYEDYKSNLLAIEKRIADDSHNPLVDLELLLTWINYNQGNLATDEEKAFFFQESMPRAITNALSRRYDTAKIDMQKVLMILEAAVVAIANNLYRNCEALNNCLRDLLNPHQNFYRKYCAKKVPIPSALEKIPESYLSEDQIAALDVGSCLDFKDETGKWNVVFIQQLSTYRTEVEVMRLDDRKEWISFQTGGHRLAPFGTKSAQTQAVEATVANMVLSDEPTVEVGQETRTDQELQSLDVEWKKVLSMGDMVDVQDKNGIWYQAVVLNIEKSEESVAFIPLEDTEETVTSTGKSSGEDAMDIESVATDTVSTLDTDRHVHFNDSVAPGHTDENRLLAQGDIPCVPSDRLQQKESSRCYVAYVGLPEKMDEWIPLYSVRIQQLNSFSKGRRGEGLDREELIYLANYKIQSSSQAEIDNYAVHRFNSFVEPSIISIVNKFGNAGGFDEIMLQLQRVVGKEITIVPVFPLMTILGKLDRVLTRSFLARYTQNFLNICSNILMNLSLADMRTISIEACIEPSLRALELVATAYYGRNPAMGKYTEPLKLAMGLKVISSPYLNRRLGGIRILNDLLKRVEVGKCTDPIGIKKGKANYDGREIDTYRVFPVLYHYTTHQMCTILKNSSTLVEFFEGSNAHESLVARATNILNVMAMEDCINDQLLSTMLRAGLDDKLNHTLQAVVEVIENVSIYALENVWYLLSKYEKSSALSVGYIDVVGAVAIACRKKLLACNTEEAGYLDFVRSRSTGDADSYHEYTDLESENNVFNYIQTTLNLHRSALMKLWDYAIDNGTVAEAMSARSLSKLEVVIDIGHSFATALQLPFPWTLQWLRLHELVYSAMDALRKATTVTPSLRVIQLFTCSWPIVKADHFVAEVPYLPFGTPRRSDVANYMENSYGIMKLITAAVLQLKKQFNSYCSAIGYSLAGEITSANDLSSATLNGSRISYRTQLEKLTDFLHVFVRCSDSLVIKKEVVESIWNSVVKDSLTMEETDTILSFCTRIIIKILDRRASAEKIDSTESIGPEDKTTSTKRSTVCDRESIKWIFTNLLCNTSFIQSPHFSQKAFECLEKWFRWINGDAGMIMEADNSTASFVVLADPLALIGLNVFPQIIFLCVPDTVVSSAIKFLCSLPHYLKKNLKQTSISANFVNELLLQCIKTLEDIQKDIHQSDVRLNRVLRFLEGLMDETTLKSKHSPPPHGSIGRGNPITFKLSSSSKRLKKSCGDIIMRTNDTVEDLINLVAKQLCVPASDLKIFRRGKEISILEHHKSIHQLKMLSEKESLVVADRPNTSCNNSSTLSVDCGSSLNNRNDIIQSLMDGNSPHVIGQKRGTSDLTDNICSEEESMEVEVANPVAILTSNNDYFELLFSLLCSSAETEADKLWSIITRLPSSTEVFNTWLMLDCTNVSSLLKSRRLNEPINFARLLYSLQIIELLLQPAPSAMELAVQEQYIDADMYRIIVDWPSNFLSLGGFQAICEASTWILNAIDAYIKNDFKQAGITCNSIQLALGLVAKLIKAFLIRICISLEKVHSLKVLLAAISSDVFKSITREGKNLSVLSLLDGKKKSDEEIDWSTVSEMKIEESDDPMTMLKMEDSTAVDFILAEEWGWRIDFSDPFGNDLKGFNLLKLQENALVTMILVAKMGMHTSFGLKSNTVGLAAWKDPARKENVLSLLDDYLCVWAMISLADSTVVAALSSSNGTNSKVTTTYLVRHLLLAEYPKPLSVQEVDTILKDTIATWFSGSIRSMIDLISTFKASVENDADIDGPSDAFKSSILLSLLECKIRINHNTLGEQARDISAAAPLFALTSFIVSKKVNSKQVANSIVTTAVEIIEELTSLDIRSHLIWLDKGVLTGNLMLLHSISQLELEAVQQLLVSKLDFFLSKCLGLVSVENASNPILCLDDSSRLYTYELVQSICAQEKSLAIEVLRVAKSVHHTFAKPTVFGVKPEKETRAANGYVGLRNLGSTCYMNSLLQILFMNKTIKNYLLYHIPILDDQSEEETKNDLPLQLKKVFLYLEYSEKKSYAPLDWTFAFKDELGINPTNVSQQQDAQEFLQLLCERFETSIDIYRRKLESKGASTIPVDILRHTFGGKLCNQVFQSQCNGFSEGKMKDIREQEESFVCISLEVKNSKDLVTSLGKFVQGEEISDYLWEDNCPRVTITKRQVISELSDMVIFHLKRFELNFDTFHREKVNDSFSFPQNLNLFPFTKEGVNQIDNNSTSDEEYYEYELTGIIVHTGTSDSGHYYSFIKATKTGKENKWYEFNDADVSNFQEIMIEAECFGGTTVSHEYIAATQQFIASEMTNQKNAYMLVYNRKNKLNDKIADVEDSMTNLKRILDASAPEESLSFRKNVMMDVAQSIAQENAEHAVMVRVINLNHFNFCYELLQIVDRETRALKSESMLLLMCEVLRESYSLVVNYILRSTHVNMFQKFGKMLLKLLPDYQQLFFDHITETPTEETKASSNADYQNSRLAAIKFPLFKSIMESFVSDIGHFLCNLTVAKEELRKLFAELVMLVISLYQDCRTDQFYDPNIGFTSLNVGTISNSFSNGGGSTNGAFAAVATAVGTASSVPHQVGNYQHAHAIDTKDDIDFDDEELQMAIKMSQELMEPGGVEFPKGDVIDFAEAEDNVVATVAEPLDGNEDPMDVEKDIEESIPATDFEAGNGSEAEDPFQNKMIEKLLFNLTLDANIQSLAENWRRSGSYIWLLLELAKNSAVVRDYFLQREAISGVVNLILAEQSPLCDVLYVKSSRKHAPSSYVYVGKTKDGNCTCAAKNIPDWTCLMELIAILISNSRVGNMYHDSIVDVEVATSIEKNLVSEPYLSVWDRQCLTTKTLYSTLFRQERYVPATSVIITQLSVDNIQFSNLIAEVIYEVFSLANAESTYHIFMAMDSFLSISDSLAIQRARTLFGAGNSNIFQLMSTMKDQPLRSRLICVFIRSFVFLANKIPSLMTAIAQPSSHMHNWVPWMLRFSYRYVNRCNQENNERSAIAAAAMMQQQSRVEAVSTMPDIVSKGNESTKDPTSDSLSLQTPALVPPPPPHKALEESISSSQSKNPRVENLSIITDTQSIADTPPVTKGTFVRVYGEDESERELPWLVRAEKALESLIALVVSTGAILETFIPEDTFSESIAEVAAAAEVNNSVPFDPVTASMQDADMMTDEQLAEFLLNHKFDNDLD